MKPTETSPVCLSCDGLTIRDFALPPFRVEAGRGVCLHVRLPSPKWQEELLPILAGWKVHPALHFFGTVAYADRPMPRRRWWGRLYNPSGRNWLTTDRGLTLTEALTVLDSVDWPEDLRIGSTSCNDRTMLALEACLLRPPDLLVFDMCGNGPEIASPIFERLASRTPPFALLYLKTRFYSYDLCLPGAVCLEMARTPAHATIAE